ncbi:MAG: SusD/RagB family nutrient-binding outer membrane lipoprotein [Flavobacteriaceae bacterium]|nr:SusD/RagB family nutrient-binding outer membrane lipoprotein [Flavobacteriaceae bacterium]
MKKLLSIVLISSLLVASCDFDKDFEEMNIDPTKAAQLDVNNKLASVFLRTSGERYENWRASFIYSSQIVQHMSSTATYWTGNFYTRNEGYATSLFDRAYPQQVKEIEDIIFQLTNEENTGDQMGIARIWRAFIYHRITDLYGDIPYSEAGKGYIEGVLKPKYDAQQDIYMDMLKEIEEGVAQLGSSSSLGTSDLIFQGDMTKWKKFGNSLMLRLAMRLSKADPATAQAWASKAIAAGVMTSNADIAYVQHLLGPEGINKNGHGEVFMADGNPRLSKTFVDFLKDDPRLPILGARRSDGSTNPADLMGMPNGLTSGALEAKYGTTSSDYAEPNRGVITGEDAPMVFQTYAEVEFMIAEAITKGWASGDAKAHYEAGVKAAMQMLSMLYPNASAVSDAEVATYLAAKPFDASKALQMIGEQYWAATFFNEYEAFANWRRTGFPVLQPFGGEAIYDGNVTNGTIPRRLIYPGGEASTNADNFAAAIARQGANEFTTRVWWDK